MKRHINAKGLSFTLALLLVGVIGMASHAIGQVSPAGTWDLLISGSERGIAYITFEEDGTLSGYEVLSPSQLPDPEDADASRNNGEIAGRISVPGPTPGTTVERLLGFGELTGSWSFDTEGKVIGVYTEGSQNLVCTTNLEIIISSNVIDGEIIITLETNTVVDCVTNAILSGVSFKAIVRPDRITIKTTGPNGNTTLKGVPAMDAPDISGSYYVQGKKNNGTIRFVELLTFVPSDVYFNGYDVVGSGPGYEVLGRALISNQKKLGLVSVTSDENATLTSAIGGINVNRGRASLSSVDLDGTRGQYNLTRSPQ